MNPTLFMANTISVTDFATRNEWKHMEIDSKCHFSAVPGNRLNPHIIFAKKGHIVTEAEGRLCIEMYEDLGNVKGKFLYTLL